MNNPVSENRLNTRDVVLHSASPEQRLVMAMLTSPTTKNLWGDPVDIAAAVSWEQFLATTDEKIKPYLHWACQNGPYAMLVPQPVQAQLATVRQAARIRNLRWSAELRQIVETFRSEAIPLIVVKGAVLQRSVYPDPSTRPMSDIDLVVHCRDMVRVYCALEGLGFISRMPRDVDTSEAQFAPDAESCFFKRIGDHNLLVEIHTHLEMHSDYQLPPWAHCSELQGTDGILVPTLDPHTALRHICFHLAKHGFVHGLMWLLDIRLFVEKNRASIRWDDFVNECDPSARPLLACTLALADEWLSAGIPQQALSIITVDKKNMAAPLIWHQMWDYGRTSQPLEVITALFSGDVQRVWTKLCIRAQRWTAPTVNRKASRAALFLKRLGMDFAYLRARIQAGGLRLSSLRAGGRTDLRFKKLRALLWPPLGK